jgi:DNA-binding SARP family transcriptional activator/tetratricopeptide (TPR) repeat protein
MIDRRSGRDRGLQSISGMLSLRTFGVVALERDGVALVGRFTQRRRLALLVLLASARQHPISRERVLGLLWPEAGEDHARHALAQLVYELRRDLGQDVVTGGPDHLALDSRCVGSDLDAFLSALQCRDFESAASVYKGPFLDGFFVANAPAFERWVEEQRATLAARHLQALESLAIACEGTGNFAAACEHRRRIVVVDPLSARHAVAFMRALARAGDTTAAIRHATMHKTLLRGELDVDADPAVAAFARQLAQDTAISAAASPPPDAVAATGESPSVVANSEPSLQEPLVPPAAAVRRRPWLARRRGAILVSSTLLVAVYLSVVHHARGAVDTPRAVVLGEIGGPDTVLALAMREAVRAELERAPDVNVVNEPAVSQTLRLLDLDSSVRLTEAVADDVAIRRGAPFVVVGSITPIATGAALSIRLVDATHERTLAALTAHPGKSTDIVRAIASVAAELRQRVSTATPSLTTPLPAVTTTSVEALRDYALARAALGRVDRPTAIAYAEAALAHDSSFALAHLLLGDLYWYLDEEHRAEDHLRRAYALSRRLPVRERLLVAARYMQLVLDRPDSALTYWRELRAAYPTESLGYEGAVWADLACGNAEDAAAAADSALRLDSAAAPQVRNRMMALLALRDTAAALHLTRTAGTRWPYLERQVLLATYELRRDWKGFQHALDSLAPAVIGGVPNLEMAPVRQGLLLSQGRLREAEVYEQLVVARMHAQFALRSELWQARAELAWNGSPAHARTLLHQALVRLDSTDLSPPATSRLAELAAGVAASAGDNQTIAALRRIVLQRDAGRSLSSHRLALLTIDAADAFTHGDWARAVALLDEGRRGKFFGRSEATVALLEADALAQMGEPERARADSLYHVVSTAAGVRDDGETWMVLRPIAARVGSRYRR